MVETMYRVFVTIVILLAMASTAGARKSRRKSRSDFREVTRVAVKDRQGIRHALCEEKVDVKVGDDKRLRIRKGRGGLEVGNEVWSIQSQNGNRVSATTQSGTLKSTITVVFGKPGLANIETEVWDGAKLVCAVRQRFVSP